MGKLAFKQISFQNWLQPDMTVTRFKKIGSNGQFHTITPEDYVQAALTPKLVAAVPEDIQALFEVARGAILYGYFFYPLYALAKEQLFRIAEAALKQRCKELQMPTELKSGFAQCIKCLAQRGTVSRAEATRWHNIRQLRNAASHPTYQMICTRADALATLAYVAQDINRLFESA